MNDEVMVVLSTAPSSEEGIDLGRRLVEERLAACVNVVPRIRSIYVWEGGVQESEEALLMIKTRRDRYAALERRLQALHSYTVPEILALPVAAGAETYVRWIEDSVSVGGGDTAP